MGEDRYSSGCRSNASSSAVVPSSRAASSYSARACPISFWAIDENATSSSRLGAIPVHSESRHPRTSSSSASSSRRRTRLFTCLCQLRLERVAVHAVVVPLQLVDELVHLVDGLARNDPQRHRLAPPAVLLPRVDLCEGRVRSGKRPRVLERLAFPLLSKHLEDHA